MIALCVCLVVLLRHMARYESSEKSGSGFSWVVVEVPEGGGSFDQSDGQNGEVELLQQVAESKLVLQGKQN